MARLWVESTLLLAAAGIDHQGVRSVLLEAGLLPALVKVLRQECVRRKQWPRAANGEGAGHATKAPGPGAPLSEFPSSSVSPSAVEGNEEEEKRADGGRASYHREDADHFLAMLSVLDRSPTSLMNGMLVSCCTLLEGLLAVSASTLRTTRDLASKVSWHSCSIWC